MEQQTNEGARQAAATDNRQVTLIVLAPAGNRDLDDLKKLAGNVPRNGVDAAMTIVGDIDGETAAQLGSDLSMPVSRADSIGQAIEQCTSRWIMFCNSTTRLADDALQRLVGKADEDTGAVIPGLDHPDEGIFTLQGKLFASSAVRGIDVSADDVCGDGYTVLQRILQRAHKVAGLGEGVLDRIDLSQMRGLLKPAHRELLYRMTTIYVEIQLCDRCNLDCAYCSHLSPISKPVKIPLETLEAECRRLAKVGVDEVNLMGGEPLLHPQVIEAIELTRSILPDIKLIVSTNGLLLPRMSKEFWQACRDNKVVLRITPYPRAKGGAWNFFKYVYLIKKNRVKMESTGWRFGFRHQLLSEKAEFDATANYLCCQLHCTQVRDATLWPCAYVAYAFNLNNKFGTSFKHAAGDSLPLTDDTTATDVRLWLLRTKPFCSHCGIINAKHVNWKRSEYARSEWLQS